MAGRWRRRDKLVKSQPETRLTFKSRDEAARFVTTLQDYGYPSFARDRFVTAYAPREEIGFASTLARGGSIAARDEPAPLRDAARDTRRATIRCEARDIYGDRMELSRSPVNENEWWLASPRQGRVEAYPSADSAWRSFLARAKSPAHDVSVRGGRGCIAGRDPSHERAQARMIRVIRAHQADGYTLANAARRAAVYDGALAYTVLDELAGRRPNEPELAALQEVTRQGYGQRYAKARDAAPRAAPRSFPLERGHRFGVRPSPFGDLEWFVFRPQEPNIWLASGTAQSFQDARRKAQNASWLELTRASGFSPRAARPVPADRGGRGERRALVIGRDFVLDKQAFELGRRVARLEADVKRWPGSYDTEYRNAVNALRYYTRNAYAESGRAGRAADESASAGAHTERLRSRDTRRDVPNMRAYAEARRLAGGIEARTSRARPSRRRAGRDDAEETFVEETVTISRPAARRRRRRRG